MDHSHDHAEVDGPWAGGWVVALAAGLIAGVLARSFGDVGLVAALIVAAVVFGVFGVLLGAGGIEHTVTADHGTGHDGPGHH